MTIGELIQKANRLKRENKLDEAIYEYRHILELNPYFSWAYYNLGDTFFKQGKWDRAIDQYFQSLKSNPNSSWFLYCLGEALARQGDLVAAVQYLQQAIEIKPKFYKYYNTLGKVLVQQRNFDQAITNYSKAIELNSSVAHSYLGCCISYLCKGEFSLAQENLNIALKLHPKDLQTQLYSNFFQVLEALASKTNINLKKKNFIDVIAQHFDEKISSKDYSDILTQVLNIVQIYEKLAIDKDLMIIPKLDRFHHCITEMMYPGMSYIEILTNLHLLLEPATYVEIGVQRGESFKLASTSTVAVGIDPKPQLTYKTASNSSIFAVTSDEFFQECNLSTELKGHKVDFCFIDGLHLFEQALKDFINIEKYSHKNTIICFHDTLPLDEITSRRERATKFWSGDVWKIVPILKKYRPDLEILTIATKPTGLTIVTNLDSNSIILSEHYDYIIKEYIEKAWINQLKLRHATLSIISNSLQNIAKKLKLDWR